MQQTKLETNDAAYRLLFERYYSRLFLYARRIVGEEGADDVVLDVFVDIWKRFGEIDTGDNIEGYLYRAVYRRGLNYLRDHTNRDMSALEEISRMRLDAYTAEAANGERDMENKDLYRQIMQAVDELPEKCREVFILSYLHDMKNAEIAQVLGISQRTVEAHMYKALKYLRERLGHLLPIALLLLVQT